MRKDIVAVPIDRYRETAWDLIAYYGRHEIKGWHPPRAEEIGHDLLIRRHVQRISQQDIIERRFRSVDYVVLAKESWLCTEILSCLEDRHQQLWDAPETRHRIQLAGFIKVDIGGALGNRQECDLLELDKIGLIVIGVFADDDLIIRPPCLQYEWAARDHVPGLGPG